MRNYLTNCQFLQDRVAKNPDRNRVRLRFEATDRDFEGFHGSLHTQYLAIHKETKIATFQDWFAGKVSDKNYVRIYEAIPSALLLYRLLATFGSAGIAFNECDDYKCIWAYKLNHIPTGTMITFGEHKAGVSFWTAFSTPSELPGDLQSHLLSLITYLISDHCTHPYDGTVAGSVA